MHDKQASCAPPLLDAIDTNILVITVPGAPVPWGRVIPVRGRPPITDPKTRAYEERVRIYAMQAVAKARWRIVSPASYEVTYWIYREARRGDADNFQKAIQDALNGVVWKDDREIPDTHVHVREDPKNPRAVIEIVRRELPAKPKRISRRTLSIPSR